MNRKTSQRLDRLYALRKMTPMQVIEAKAIRNGWERYTGGWRRMTKPGDAFDEPTYQYASTVVEACRWDQR